MPSELAESYLRRNGIKFKAATKGRLNFDCPLCHRKGRASIENATWLWCCHSIKCDAKGNEVTLMQAHGHIYDVTGAGLQNIEELRNQQFADAMAHRAAMDTDVERWNHDLLHNADAASARSYLTDVRKLTRDTMRMAMLGWSQTWPGKTSRSHDYGYLLIPYLTKPNDPATCAMVKVRSLNPDVPKSLTKLIVDCVELNPVQRPSSMNEVVSRLTLIAKQLGRDAEAGI